MTKKATYLGDGLLYDNDRESVVLYADNGIGVQNKVYLDFDCLKKLIETLCRDYGTDAIRSMCNERPLRSKTIGKEDALTTQVEVARRNLSRISAETKHVWQAQKIARSALDEIESIESTSDNPRSRK